MSAMDKMFAQMLGINPAELGQMVEDFKTLLVKVQEQQNRIEEMQAQMNDKLDALLERTTAKENSDEHSGRNGTGDGRSQRPKRGAAGNSGGTSGGNGAE